ncbi:MAG: hypothetical protein VYA34_06415 [Myxococcota bacterium]|nr:hypothetical protein [Myxococcota bacterium]
MFDWIPEIGGQPGWVAVLVGLGAFFGFLAKNFREVLSIVQVKKTRAFAAKVELETKLTWLGQHQGQHIAAVEVHIMNKGSVRLYIENLRFSVRFISDDSELQGADPEKYPRLSNQLFFPESVIENGRLFPEQWKYAFVDPGCQDTYRYPCKIPRSAKFLMVWVKLWYPDDVDDVQNEQYFCVAPPWEPRQEPVNIQKLAG